MIAPTSVEDFLSLVKQKRVSEVDCERLSEVDNTRETDNERLNSPERRNSFRIFYWSV